MKRLLPTLTLRDSALCAISFIITMNTVHSQSAITYLFLVAAGTVIRD
jgi:hypothetical protein